MSESDNTDPLFDGQGNYIGRDRRRCMEPHPSRMTDNLHLSKGFAWSMASSIVLVTIWLMTIKGDVAINAKDNKANDKHIQAEIVARQQADQLEATSRRQSDQLIAERLNRHEADQARTMDRIFVQLDKIYELLREQRQESGQ